MRISTTRSWSRGAKGWVANLHRALEIRVGQLLGKTPHIWRDPKLQGNDFFAETLVDRLKRVAVLVTVVSPRYIRSEWTRKELDEFWKAAEAQGGVRFAEQVARLQGAQDAGADREPAAGAAGAARLRVLPDRSRNRQGPRARRSLRRRGAARVLAQARRSGARDLRAARTDRGRGREGARAAGRARDRVPRRHDQRLARAARDAPPRLACSRATPCCRRRRCPTSRRSSAPRSAPICRRRRCRCTCSAAPTASSPRGTRSRSSKSRTSSRSSARPKAGSRACCGFRRDSRSRTSGRSTCSNRIRDRSADGEGLRSARDARSRISARWCRTRLEARAQRHPAPGTQHPAPAPARRGGRAQQPSTQHPAPPCRSVYLVYDQRDADAIGPWADAAVRAPGRSPASDFRRGRDRGPGVPRGEPAHAATA